MVEVFAGSLPVVVAMLAIVLTVIARSRPALAFALVPVTVLVESRRPVAHLASRVPDPVHHPLAPRAPGVR